jgi:predicted phage terminase large subunit-like protein
VSTLLVSLVVLMGLTPINLNKFELFVAQYLPHYLTKPVANFHRDWYRALDDDSIEFCLIEAGRLSAKSTIASVCAPIYFICEKQWPEIQTFSQSAGSTGMSTKWMRKIQRELNDNQLLIHDYGLTKGEVWNLETIQVKRGDGHVVDVYVRGKHSAARGGRGLVLIDDPQDEDDCKSETVLTRDEDWLFSDVLPIITEGQRLIMIATPISPLSLASKFKSLPEVTTLSFPAENPAWSGKSSWPEQWSDEYLAKRLRMMGRDRYGAEYLCEPKVSGNPMFRAEWFPSYDPETAAFDRVLKGSKFVVLGMDCAESKSTQADNTAIVILLATLDPDPSVYVLSVEADHWTTKEGAERVMQAFAAHQQHKSVVETRVDPNKSPTNTGDAMYEEIKSLEVVYGKHVNLYGIKPDRDKAARALHVQSFCQRGKVHVNRHSKEQQALLSELIMFTGGDQHFKDDRVDAFVHAMTAVIERANGGAEGITIRSGLENAWS